MKSFPMFIRTTGRCVVIVGGGETAAQKARLMLKTDAEIVLVAPDLDAELAGLVAEGRARHETTLTAASFDNAAMAFVGTGCPGLDASAQALARAVRCPVNVVDRPEMCDITTPALVDRDPVVIAIGSEGTAPVLTREIKVALETMLAPRIGALAALAGRLRPAVAQSIPHDQRRRFWSWVFRGAPRAAWDRGGERAASAAIKQAVQEGRVPGDTTPGRLSVIDVPEGGADLLTLRAVRRLQEADLIVTDAGLSAEVLELARRDAHRLTAPSGDGSGDRSGDCSGVWPAERRLAAIAAEAGADRQVVWLRAGPGAALPSEVSGVTVEHVPMPRSGFPASGSGPARVAF